MTTITTPQSQALWMLNSVMVERVTADQTNYAVVDDTAHLYVIASPGGIEGFFRDLGEPATALELPAPSAPDVPAVVSTAARYGISILRPPA